MALFDGDGREFEYVELVNNPRRAKEKKVMKILLELSQGRMEKMGFWVLGSNLQGFIPGERAKFMKWLEKFHRWLTEMNVRYMAVTEQGKEGRRIHSHMIVDRYIDWSIVRNAWSRITGIEKPHVDVRVFEWNKAGELCQYLSKYLVKGGGAVEMKGRNLQCTKGIGKKAEQWWDEKELKKKKIKIYMRRYLEKRVDEHENEELTEKMYPF